MTLSGATTAGQGQWMGSLHFQKFQHYRNLTIRLFSVISGHSLEESYSFAEMESVYSTAQAVYGAYGRYFKLLSGGK